MITQVLRQTKQAAKNLNINQVAANINQIASLPKQQINRQQFGLQKSLPQTLQSIKKTLKQNPNQAGDNFKLSNNLQIIAEKINDPALKKQTKNAAFSIRQVQNSNRKQQLNGIIQNIASQTIVNQSMNEIQTPTLPSIPVNVPNTQKTPTQHQLLPFQQFMKSTLQYTKPFNVPMTVKSLQLYAKTFDTIPMGTISNSDGQAFVGVSKIQIGSQTYYQPFKQNTIIQPQLPNIPVQLQYYANKTINSWNNYVSDQAKLVGFVKKVNSQQKRTKYMQQQFKKLNVQTFSAQVLATLCYYYVFLPIDRYMKKSVQTQAQFSQDNFYLQYQIGTSPKDNPLLLNRNTGILIAQQLLNYQKNGNFVVPSLKLITIQKTLENIRNQVNKKQINKCLNYVNKRQTSANAFFQGYGLTLSLCKQLLALQDFSSVKKKKLVLSSGLANGQIQTMVQNVIKKQQNKSVKTETWNIYWGSQYIYCHDYIWASNYYN